MVATERFSEWLPGNEPSTITSMMPEPLIGAAKVVGGLLVPLFKAVGREWNRRSAAAGLQPLSNLDPQIDEAIQVLARNDHGPIEAVVNFAKGELSGRPAIFDHSPVQDWLAMPEVRVALRDAVYHWLIDPTHEPASSEALAHYVPTAENDSTAGHVAFSYAVAFIAVSLARDLDVGDRISILLLNTLIQQRMAVSESIPHELFSRIVLEEVERLRRQRFLVPGGIEASVDKLLSRITEGDLSYAGNDAKARAIAMCVRWLSGQREVPLLRALLEQSRELADTPEVELANAFVEEKAAGWKAAHILLKPIDTPERRTAALQTRTRSETPEAGIAWLEAAGLSARDLDADGKFFLLAKLSDLSRWDDAIEVLGEVEGGDFDTCPALHHIVGVTNLVATVVPELRDLALSSGMQLDAASFPLSDKPDDLERRRLASQHFEAAEQAFSAADNDRGVAFAKTARLWIALRDPVTEHMAREDLERAVHGPDGLEYVPMAIAFGCAIDHLAIERALKRDEALNPSGEGERAFVRFALIRTLAPDKRADAFEKHRDVLHAHLNPAGLAYHEVRELIELGRIDRASEVLEKFGDIIPTDARRQLQSLIEAGPERQNIEALVEALGGEASVAARGELVDLLSKSGFSDRLFDAWLALVSELQNRDQAEKLIWFLSKHERLAEIDEVLHEVPELLDQSEVLQAAAAWSCYRRGSFAEAWSLLSTLRANRSDPNDRALAVSILVASGRWPELADFINSEWTNRQDREVGELLSAATLASQIKSPLISDLLLSAVEKAPADAHALLGAYSIAVEAGLEELSHDQSWLERAIAASGEDGPLKSISLADLAAQAPEWNSHTDEVWSKWRSGEIPISLAAKASRRPALDLQLGQMVSNQYQRDPRKRHLVPAYSGRRPTEGEAHAGKLGLEFTSIVTLAALDLLDKVLSRGNITVSHSVLKTLFHEQKKLGFHQPSQTRAAHQLRLAVARKQLSAFEEPRNVRSKLIGLVGFGLASMLTEATAPAHARRTLVVRSYPVTRAGSLTNEPADLSEYADVLCSCQGVVDWLTETGQLLASEEVRARAYLEHNEQRWPNEPKIDATTDLLLDDLSISYLRNSGVLDKLPTHGMKVSISKNELDDADALIALEERAGEIDFIISRVRHALQTGFSTGSVSVAPMYIGSGISDRTVEDVQTLIAECPLVVCDDRCINRNAEISTADGKAKIWTTLDLLDQLEREGSISANELLNHRTALRRLGLTLVGVRTQEILDHLSAAQVRDGRLQETAELRAIRENVSLTLMRSWPSFPAEHPWLTAWNEALTEAITSQWSRHSSPSDAAARSDWLLNCVDPRNWAEAIGVTDTDLARHGHAWLLFRVSISERSFSTSEGEDAFNAWMTSQVEALKDHDPWSYDWLTDTLSRFVRAVYDGDKHVDD